MIATNNKSFFLKLWYERDTGKNYHKFYKKYKNNGYKYMHDYIGTNARMTETQAIIGIEQLKKLNNFVKKRNQNATIILNEIKKFHKCFYNFEFSKKKVQSFYRLNLIINPKYYKKFSNRNKILDDMLKNNSFCQVGGCSELYLEIQLKTVLEKNS